MAIQSQPNRIPEPFAGSGNKNSIPATNATPSATQAASWASGFPPECSQPLSAGGCPVPRNDVNGVLNQISQDTAYRQDGGVWSWSAQADYDVHRIVRGSNGMLYYSKVQSGPSTGAGAQDPTLDTSRTYWASPLVPTMPTADSSAAAASTAFVSNKIGSRIAPSYWYLDSVNGSDSNSGLSAAAALKTYDGLVAALAAYPIGTKDGQLYVTVASGTYSQLGIPHSANGFVQYAFASGAVVDGVYAYRTGSRITLTGGPVTFTSKIDIGEHASIWLGSSFTATFKNLSGNACIDAYAGAYFNANGVTASITLDNCSCSFGVAYAHVNSIMTFRGSSFTFTGQNSGPRCSVETGSRIIDTNSSTFFPGTGTNNVDSSSTYN